jgi:dihydrofolate synthase/folylpolyglutamate synthase
MQYEEAMSYLSSAMRFGIKPGLARTSALVGALGHPERHMRFVHIAGTNGKGSVSVMVESAIRQAGIKSGLFTSPHLSSYTERIRVAGEDISRERLAAMVELVKQAAQGLVSDGVDAPTEFELCTALCLEHFRRQEVKLAVMEVGLGGRYDSTNIISPDVTVITHIAYDHMERLGKTLGRIAFDKCGTIKPGVEVISASQSEEAALMIRREAKAKGAPLREPGRNYEYSMTRLGLSGTEVEFTGANLSGRFTTSLVGVHQADNAAAALAALDCLIGSGWQIAEQDISKGLSQAVHPGRFEVINGDPLVILDGAHNPDGAKALSETLRHVMGGRKPVAIMGFSADKQYVQMIKTLAGGISSLIGTDIAHTRSGCVKCSDIAEAGNALGVKSACIESHEDALQKGQELARSEGVPLLVCGSLYLIGELRELVLGRRQ